LRDWLGEAKAKQVYLILRDRILSGALGFGAKLPTENELAEYYAVSRVTVRRALGELERERFIERRRSAGTRVIYRAAPAPVVADISGVLANIADMVGARRSSFSRSIMCRRRAPSPRRSVSIRMLCCSARSACARSTACRSPI
jgi:GntR family transcriptional regulator